MKKKPSFKKTIKPSERESITEFTTSFGGANSYESRMKRRRILTAACVVAGLIFLIVLGYFLTEFLIGITELPLA